MFLHRYNIHIKVNKKTVIKIIIIVTGIVLLCLFIYFFENISNYFFEDKNAPRGNAPRGELIKVILTFIAGIVAIGAVYYSAKRVQVMEKGNVDTRFKDAALLLANEAAGANISGIYAFHQIAVEASKGDRNERGYVKTIHDILCAFVRENWKKRQDDNPEVGGKATIVLQTITDVLFKNKNDIYKEYRSDFSNCDFSDINFGGATITSVDFSFATLRDVNFNKATLTDVFFGYATLTDVSFRYATLTEIYFDFGTLTNVGFQSSTLIGVYFFSATLAEVNFYSATISHVHFYFAKVEISLCRFNH